MPVIAVVVGIFLAISGGYVALHRFASPPKKAEPVKKTQQEKIVLHFPTSTEALASSTISVAASAASTVDISAEIEAVQSATGDIKAMQCAACDQFAGDARTQCLAALGCN
jgi:hypothetical protein